MLVLLMRPTLTCAGAHCLHVKADPRRRLLTCLCLSGFLGGSGPQPDQLAFAAGEMLQGTGSSCTSAGITWQQLALET